MPNEWNLAQVTQYISNSVEEDSTLDYKAADALGKSDGKKKEITKDVSAMANSAGGSIIYGIKEHDETDKRHLPERVDWIDRKEFPKEWLEHVINSIQPRIEGVAIHPITHEGQPNQAIYVVEIPQSTTAHQARDYRYYRRFNFESVPMEDYEVRDVMNRAKTPNAEAQFGFELVKTEGGTHSYALTISVKNRGEIVINSFKPDSRSALAMRAFGHRKVVCGSTVSTRPARAGDA